MKRNTMLNIAFLLLLISLPLISVGSNGAVSALWSIGLVLLLLGFAIPLSLRFVTLKTEARDEPDVGEEPS